MANSRLSQSIANPNLPTQLSKFFFFFFNFFGQIVPAWLSCLPLKGDLIEAKVVHDQLCSMVER